MRIAPESPNITYRNALMPNEMEIILKISERCNINCSYCYFFNMENQDYKNHSPYISFETVEKLISFIVEAINNQGISSVKIDFHGGEPLMVGKTLFSRICKTLRSTVDEIAELRLSVQTNGMLIDEEWITLFEEYEIFVGFSIDGPQEYHDRFRVDHKNKGTYSRTVDKIALVEKAVLDGRVLGMGAICVINPSFDPVRIYDHLVKVLEFKQIHMILPDETHHSYDISNTKAYIHYLKKLFACWVNDDNSFVSIRLLDSVLYLISNGQAALNEYVSNSQKSIAFTVSSEGELGHDDTLRNAMPDLFNTGMNVSNTQFSIFASWYYATLIEMKADITPTACNECGWQKICHAVNLGSSPLHRYKNGKTDQKTVYCRSLQELFIDASQYMGTYGLSMEKFQEVLHIPHI